MTADRPLSSRTAGTAGTGDAGVFERERPRLRGLAYRITGSRAEAEDVVQDTWLRWQGVAPDSLERPEAWLTTVTSRIALDRLKRVARVRETYVGPWLPELVGTEAGPEARAELAESLTLGFLTVLERLAPTERVVFLLADVFGLPYAQIAGVVDRSEDACRQVASRARRRVREDTARFSPTTDEAWQVTEAFLRASAAGDLDGLVRLLDPEAVLVADGGADHHAARRPIAAAAIPRFVVGLLARVAGRGPISTRLHLLNGQPAVVVESDGATVATAVFDIADGRVRRLYLVVNPKKMGALGEPPIA